MDAVSCKTKSISAKDVQKNWLLVDASNKIVGRLAAQIAYHLRGKHKPNYTPHIDCGDHIVVVNSSQLRFSGKKWANKQYIRHTGYPGGQRHTEARHLHEKYPTRVLEYAVRGMLSKNSLGRQQFRNLHVYAQKDHPHEAQNPVSIS